MPRQPLNLTRKERYDLSKRLYTAARNNDFNEVERAVEAGASVNRQYNGRYAFNQAAANGNLPLLQYFLRKGAKIDKNEVDYNYVLHYAAKNGQTHILQFLHENYPTQYLQQHNQKNFDYEYLRNPTTESNHASQTPLLIALANSHTDAAEFLIHHEADIHLADQFQSTPLHCAAIKGQTDLVSLLLEKKAKVKTRNSLGNTALDDALYSGQVDAATILLLHGAKPSVSMFIGPQDFSKYSERQRTTYEQAINAATRIRREKTLLRPATDSAQEIGNHKNLLRPAQITPKTQRYLIPEYPPDLKFRMKKGPRPQARPPKPLPLSPIPIESLKFKQTQKQAEPTPPEKKLDYWKRITQKIKASKLNPRNWRKK